MIVQPQAYDPEERQRTALQHQHQFQRRQGAALEACARLPCLCSFSCCFVPLLGSFCRNLRPEVTRTSKLLNGITAEADVTTDLYVTSDPRLSTGLSEHQCRVRAVAAAGHQPD